MQRGNAAEDVRDILEGHRHQIITEDTSCTQDYARHHGRHGVSGCFVELDFRGGSAIAIICFSVSSDAVDGIGHWKDVNERRDTYSDKIPKTV